MSRYHAIFSWHCVTRSVSCKEAHSLCRILENAREELGTALAPRDGCRENRPIVPFGPACAEKSNPVYHGGEDGAEGAWPGVPPWLGGRRETRPGVLLWLRGCRETRPGVPNSLSLCREIVAGVPLSGEPGRGEPPGMPSGRTSSREMPPSVPFSCEPGRGMTPGVQRAAVGVVQPPAFLGVDRPCVVQPPAFLGSTGEMRYARPDLSAGVVLHWYSLRLFSAAGYRAGTLGEFSRRRGYLTGTHAGVSRQAPAPVVCQAAHHGSCPAVCEKYGDPAPRVSSAKRSPAGPLRVERDKRSRPRRSAEKSRVAHFSRNAGAGPL